MEVQANLPGAALDVFDTIERHFQHLNNAELSELKQAIIEIRDETTNRLNEIFEKLYTCLRHWKAEELKGPKKRNPNTLRPKENKNDPRYLAVTEIRYKIDWLISLLHSPPSPHIFNAVFDMKIKPRIKRLLEKLKTGTSTEDTTNSPPSVGGNSDAASLSELEPVKIHHS